MRKTVLNSCGGVLVVMMLLGLVALTSAQDPQPTEYINKPTFPARFRADFLFISRDSDTFIPPSASAAFDTTGYPNWFGRENFTVRGTAQSSFFFASEKKIYLTSNGYHGDKCYEMDMNDESLDPHPAYKALKFYMDFNNAPEDKFRYQGKRLARGKLGNLWQDANDPRIKVYEYQPPNSDFRAPIILRDITFDYIFETLTPLPASYFDSTMTVPDTVACKPAVFKKK